MNGVKSLFNWISKSSYFTISSRNPDSQDYHETAHDFAEKVNALEPLTPEHVLAAACPTDVVVHLEKHVDSRPSRAGFFGNLGIQEGREDAVSRNMEDDREHSFSPD